MIIVPICAMVGVIGFAAYRDPAKVQAIFSLAADPRTVLDENITLIRHPHLRPDVKRKVAPRKRKDGTVERRTLSGKTVWAAPDAKFDPGGKGKLVPLGH
jgi:hypothetical protein